MPDIASIGAFLTSIKTATEIAKALREIDASLEKAETKLKIADLMDALAEARIKAVDVQEIIQEKDKKISELEIAFELKSKLIRYKNGYYEVDEQGDPIGDPYCSHCWEVNHKTVHLNYGPTATYKVCPVCKNAFHPNTVPEMEARIKDQSARRCCINQGE